MSLSCGIDFGTTNSAAGVNATKNPTMVPLEQTHITLPSALFFKSFNDTVFFGREAQEMYLMGEDGRFMRSLKRILGTELMGYHTQVGKNVLKFDYIISLFLKNIKNKIDAHAANSIENVVMGRPVRFRNDDPAGDKRAEAELDTIARSVGFKNISFQYEPIAAAFAHEHKLDSEKLACIIDIGGGTSDFTVIRLGPRLKNKLDRSDDILASTGIMIGGNDFDKALSIRAIMPHLGKGSTYGAKHLSVPSSIYFDLSEWSKINSAYTQKNINEAEEILSSAHQPNLYERLVDVLHNNLGHKLLNTVEESKILLTDCDELDSFLDYLSNKPSVRITRTVFENAIMNSVIQVEKTLDECMKQAGTAPNDIDLIIFTGGSTEIPLIQQRVKSFYPNAMVADSDKLSSVGLGLAYDARRRFG